MRATTKTWLGFDDTPNRLGIQWSVNTEVRANAKDPSKSSIASYSPQQHSIELGVLRHRFSNHQSADSGQGFKVVTDNSLQLTAQQGVLLSTFGIRHSQTEHESAWVNDAGQQQLKISTELSTTYQEAKQAHLQDPSALQAATSATDSFKTAAQIMDERLNTEVMGAADMLMVSRDSIYSAASNTLTSAHTIIRQSGSTQSDMIAGNSRMAADSISSLSGVGGQADKSGWHMSANTGALAIQAQGGELQLHSQEAMTLGSEAGQVNIASPKRIKLQTKGGASITIDDSGVKLVCPGEIKIKAVKKSLVGGIFQTKVLQFVDSISKRNHYLVDNDTGRVLKNRRYRLIDALTGDVILGKSDSAGRVDEYQPNMVFEILPEMGRTYSQDVGAVPPVLVEEATADAKKGSIITAKDISTEKKVIETLKAKDSSFRGAYDNNVKGGYVLDSIPVLPNGAQLISFDNLLKIKPNTGSSSKYKFINGFSSTETIFHRAIKKLTTGGYLPDHYFYIFAHASKNQLYVGGNKLDLSRSRSESEKKIAVDDFVDKLTRKQGYIKNKTLVLVSCNAGNGTSKSVAEYLSEHSNIGTVYAPTSLTSYSTLPDLSCRPSWRGIANGNRISIAENRITGHFRIFNSANIKAGR